MFQSVLIVGGVERLDISGEPGAIKTQIYIV
jgi:hypothetical protein